MLASYNYLDAQICFLECLSWEKIWLVPVLANVPAVIPDLITCVSIQCIFLYRVFNRCCGAIHAHIGLLFVLSTEYRLGFVVFCLFTCVSVTGAIQINEHWAWFKRFILAAIVAWVYRFKITHTTQLCVNIHFVMLLHETHACVV